MRISGIELPAALDECRVPGPGYPAVHVSYAQSLDGRIATATGDSRGLSAPESLELTHLLRAESDAILVGVGTVLADDPMLTCRLPQGCPSQPLRVVLDSRLRIPLECRLVRSAGEHPTMVFCRSGLDGQPDFLPKRAALTAAGVVVSDVPGAAQGLDLSSVLEVLFGRGCRLVFVEGGSAVLTAFVKQGLVDLLTVCLVPRLIGSGIDAIQDLQVGLLSGAPGFMPLWHKGFGIDLVWRLRPVGG